MGPFVTGNNCYTHGARAMGSLEARKLLFVDSQVALENL